MFNQSILCAYSITGVHVSNNVVLARAMIAILII